RGAATHRQAPHARPRGLSALPPGPPALDQAHPRRQPAGDRVLRPGDRQGPELRSGVRRPRRSPRRRRPARPRAAHGGPPARPRAGAAATRALELDDSLVEAHVVLANVERDFDWDWAGAERSHRRALALDPNDSSAHLWFGVHLMLLGRADESIAEIRRARELDPPSILANHYLGDPP